MDPNQIRPGFYRRFGKRIFDISGSFVGLLLLLPLLLVIAILVKAGSAGEVIFRQDRVGKHRKIFKICKFRTMIRGAERSGTLITASGDRRVTGVGRFLRRWKLDELPQLWNVLVGEMSLVGPRPEFLFYVQDYSPKQQEVLTERPGITDLATLEYRNEESVLAGATDRERFYREVVLPHKLLLNLEYIRSMSFSLDLKLILMTLKLIPHQPASKNVIPES